MSHVGAFEDDLVSMLDLDARAGPRRASTHVLFSQMHPYGLGARRQQAVWLHLGPVGAGEHMDEISGCLNEISVLDVDKVLRFRF